MLTYRSAIVPFILIAWSSMPIQAQVIDPTASAPPPEHGVRLVGAFGMGVGSEGGAGLLALSLRTSAGDFVARSAGTFDLGPIFGPSEETTDVALLYGRLSEGDSGWLRLAAGPSYVDIRRSGDPVECFFFICSYERERSTAFGVALQAEGALRPRRTLGIGIAGFANVNGAQSFAGATVTLHIGRVSRRADG